MILSQMHSPQSLHGNRHLQLLYTDLWLCTSPTTIGHSVSKVAAQPVPTSVKKTNKSKNIKKTWEKLLNTVEFSLLLKIP